MPDKGNLKKEELVLAHSFRVQGAVRHGGEGGSRSLRQWVVLTLQSGSSTRRILVHSFLSPFYSGQDSSPWKNAAMFRMALPILMNLH